MIEQLSDEARELLVSGTLLAVYASARVTAIARAAAERLID